MTANTQTPQTADIPLVQAVISDKYPLHWGARASVGAVSAVLWLAEIGYRYQFVDMLDELFEGDGHATGIARTWCGAIAGAPWHLEPARVDQTSPREKANAAFVATFTEAMIRAIPYWKTHAAGMMWGDIYGVTAREKMWTRTPSEWRIDRLQFVPPRRLGYDQQWRLAWSDWGSPDYGHVLDSFPGKFWAYEPKLFERYQTREGLGRVLAYLLGFKRFGVRNGLEFIERFGKPSPHVSWRTGKTVAGIQEIQAAKDWVASWGIGSCPGAALPDTLTAQLLGAGSNIGSGKAIDATPHAAMCAWVDEQVSKAVLLQAYTTNKGQAGGLGHSGDPFENAQQVGIENSAGQFSESVDRSLIYWIVRLNFSEDAARKYLPHYTIEIEDAEDQIAAATVIDKLVRNGQPVPVRYVGGRFKLPLAAPGEQVLDSTGIPRVYADSNDAAASGKPAQPSVSVKPAVEHAPDAPAPSGQQMPSKQLELSAEPRSESPDAHAAPEQRG